MNASNIDDVRDFVTCVRENYPDAESVKPTFMSEPSEVGVLAVIDEDTWIFCLFGTGKDRAMVGLNVGKCWYLWATTDENFERIAEFVEDAA